MRDVIEIASGDLWFKIVDFLQQNWALPESGADGAVKVHFLDDDGGVFDEMSFASIAEAESGLTTNGFGRYADDPESHAVIGPPRTPYYRGRHINGSIYSSGRFWKSA